MTGFSLHILYRDIPEKTDTLTPWQDFSMTLDKTKSVSGTSPAHIFIEGDNYPALLLLKKEYTQKVDCIYIDPPYNTGSGSFTYNDSRFLLRTDGPENLTNNPEKHSAWVSFMYRRIAASYPLLKETGCIFISLSEDEYPRLRLLCDTVFGEENFVNDFLYMHGKGKKDTWSRTLYQHTVCYAKNKKMLKEFSVTESSDWAKTNADNDTRGNWFSGSVSFSEKRSNPNHQNYFTITSPSGKVWTRQWLVSKNEMDKLLNTNRIYWGTAPDYAKVPRIKIFNGEQKKIIPPDVITCADSTRTAQKYVDGILGIQNSFANPKPVNLITYLLNMIHFPEDGIMLDYFAGSGTTLEAAAQMNKADGGKRKCIVIQNDEQVNAKSPAAQKFSTVAQIAYERCRYAAEKYKCALEYYRVV